MRLSRRQVLIGGISSTLAGAAYARFFEPSWLDQSTKAVSIRGRSLQRPLRVLHLSDLHVSRFVPVPFLKHAFEMGASTKPDFICLTGDYITQGEPFDAIGFEASLRWLASVAPTYAVFGNHDGSIGMMTPESTFVGRLLHGAGISMVHNRSHFLKVGGSVVRLAGVGDHWKREVDAAAAFSSTEISDLVLVLSHNPDAKTFFDPFSWDLMLCGHTHGGQVRIPFYGAPYAPVEDRNYIQGVIPYQQGQIHITRGVGNLEGIRFNCRPEVSLLVVS